MSRRCNHQYRQIGQRRVGGERFDLLECSLCGHKPKPVRSAPIKPQFEVDIQPRSKGARPKHGMTRTPIYGIWSNMRHRYGRNIEREEPRHQVCERWSLSFEAFLQDVGPRPSPQHVFRRIDPNKPYGPDNCKWDLPENVIRARVKTFYEYQGRQYSIFELAKICGLNRSTLESRLLSQGMSVEEAMTTKLQRVRK